MSSTSAPTATPSKKASSSPSSSPTPTKKAVGDNQQQHQVPSSLFCEVKAGEPIEVVEVCKKFAEDQNEAKENLSIGGYQVLQIKIHSALNENVKGTLDFVILE